jgi:hypothetical protein
MNQTMRKMALWHIVAIFALVGCGGDSNDGGDTPGKVSCAVNADCEVGQFCSASPSDTAGLMFPAHYQDACVDEANKPCFDGRCSDSGMCALVGEECAPASEADCTNSNDCKEYNSCIFTPAVSEDALAACTLPLDDSPDTIGTTPVLPGDCAPAQKNTPGSCGYDESLKGKLVGDHIKNFGVKTWEQCAHYLHQDCGGDTKVVWLVLSTGW